MPIALTFDDGPRQKSTVDLLVQLETLRIPATFFVLGQMVEKSPAVLKRVAASQCGHQIGNHSWSHPHFRSLTDDQIKDEISKTEDLIENTLGESVIKLMRPPWGEATASQRKMITSLGYQLVFWNLDSNDWNHHVHKNAADISNFILKNIKDGQIVLAHDIHDRTIEAMKILLPQLKQRGFLFATVSQLGTLPAVAGVSHSPVPGTH